MMKHEKEGEQRLTQLLYTAKTQGVYEKECNKIKRGEGVITKPSRMITKTRHKIL